MTNNEQLVLPCNFSIFEITNEGKCSVADTLVPDFYIKDSQFNKLLNPNTATAIKKAYGKYIGVLSTANKIINVPTYSTAKYVLG